MSNRKKLPPASASVSLVPTIKNEVAATIMLQDYLVRYKF